MVSPAMALVGEIAVPSAPMELLSDPFWTWAGRATIVAAIWFAVGPLWAALWPGPDGRERADARA